MLITKMLQINKIKIEEECSTYTYKCRLLITFATVLDPGQA